MKLAMFEKYQAQAAVDLLADVFTRSEGEQEGQLIRELVENIIRTEPQEDALGFVATDYNDQLMGVNFFSRFALPSQLKAYILSPMGVATSAQGTGIGQSLITFGLEYLKLNGADIAITYGDPNYYHRVGFSQIDEDVIPAPFKLSQPHGWLAQSLSGDAIPKQTGTTHCIPALSRQEYW